MLYDSIDRLDMFFLTGVAVPRPVDHLHRMFRRPDATRSDDARPPLVRLRSLLVEPEAERARQIWRRILEELEETPEPGPWIAAARTLAAERLISDDAIHYFVEILLQCITGHAASHDAEMLRLYAEIDKVKRAHGLGDDEDWYIDEAPAEWLVLNAAWDARDRQIRVSTLRALGHHDLADLLEHDPDEFHRREGSGCVDVWGVDGGAE